MGCDIHAYVEYSNGTRWRTLAEVDLDRNYGMFGLMAAVRVPGIALHQPRGLPPECGWQVAEAAKDYGDNGHSHSWLSTKEFHICCDEYERKGGAYAFQSIWMYRAVAAMMNIAEAAEKPARIVFWFDN